MRSMSLKQFLNISIFLIALLGLHIIVASPHDVCAAGPVALKSMASVDGLRYGLPPQIEKNGLRFAFQEVPLNRPDVKARILKEINYLLLDRRSRVFYWLSRADSLKATISPILKTYNIPQEFLYLAAIESNYNGRALSSAGAFGYWQFIKATALCGPKGCPDYDWKRVINNWKDERADLVKSTHSAARYLAWLNRVKKVSLNGHPDREGFNNWFLTAASYNAGPSRVIQRLNTYGTKSYWDTPLPIETEKYVPRWIALGIISKNRDFYGLKIKPGTPTAFDTLEQIKLVKDLSFADVARMLNTTPRAIWSLNSQIPFEKSVFPARHGGVTIKHTIHVPKGTGKKLLAQLEAKGFKRSNQKIRSGSRMNH
ncbi:MAG: lytic transglycosylase domain-containing protein [Desulfomonilaceae bacterium]